MDRDTARAITAEIIAAAADGPPVLVATLIQTPEDAPTGARLLIRGDGTTLGSLGLPALDEAVVADRAHLLRRGGVRSARFLASGEESDRHDPGAYTVMLEVHEPPETLLIAGGGHIGQALCRIGAMCGFRVTVVDDRPEYANEERLPEAARVVTGHFEEVLASYPVDGRTYIVAVTRGHRHDEVSLQAVIGRGAAYVGMIGSRRRARAVLRHLREAGLDPDDVAAVRTPIGLDIGAQTPEEIAVAVMAEIIQVRRGGSGLPMSAKEGDSQT